METLKFSIDINAAPEKIWEQLWGKESYTEWTTPFAAGSYMEGDLRLGGKVQFLSPGGSGMYASIQEWEPGKKAVFSHQGEIKEGVEQPIDEKTKQWSGALESYTLTSSGNGTRVDASVETNADYKEYMNSKFPEALKELKRISEQ